MSDIFVADRSIDVVFPPFRLFHEVDHKTLIEMKSIGTKKLGRQRFWQNI